MTTAWHFGRKRPARTWTRTDLTAGAGIVAGVLSIGLVFMPWAHAALVGAFLVALVPAGAGVMCWFDTGGTAAQAALTLVISLAAFSLGSAVLLWTHAWNPHALIILAALGGASCGQRLRSGVSR